MQCPAAACRSLYPAGAHCRCQTQQSSVTWHIAWYIGQDRNPFLPPFPHSERSDTCIYLRDATKHRAANLWPDERLGACFMLLKTFGIARAAGLFLLGNLSMLTIEMLPSTELSRAKGASALQCARLPG